MSTLSPSEFRCNLWLPGMTGGIYCGFPLFLSLRITMWLSSIYYPAEYNVASQYLYLSGLRCGFRMFFICWNVLWLPTFRLCGFPVFVTGGGGVMWLPGRCGARRSSAEGHPRVKPMFGIEPNVCTVLLICGEGLTKGSTRAEDFIKRLLPNH